MFLSFPIKFVISRYVARMNEQNKLLKCVFIWSFHKNLKPYLLICNKKNFLSQTFTQTCITFWTRPKEMCIKVKFWIWNQCSMFLHCVMAFFPNSTEQTKRMTNNYFKSSELETEEPKTGNAVIRRPTNK